MVLLKDMENFLIKILNIEEILNRGLGMEREKLNLQTEINSQVIFNKTSIMVQANLLKKIILISPIE